MVLIFFKHYEYGIVFEYLDKCDCNEVGYKIMNFIVEKIQNNKYAFNFFSNLIFSSKCIEFKKYKTSKFWDKNENFIFSKKIL